jgi:pimeloyl-ACP methyl ester carboxylesterase
MESLHLCELSDVSEVKVGSFSKIRFFCFLYGTPLTTSLRSLTYFLQSNYLHQVHYVHYSTGGRTSTALAVLSPPSKNLRQLHSLHRESVTGVKRVNLVKVFGVFAQEPQKTQFPERTHLCFTNVTKFTGFDGSSAPRTIHRSRSHAPWRSHTPTPPLEGRRLCDRCEVREESELGEVVWGFLLREHKNTISRKNPPLLHQVHQVHRASLGHLRRVGDRAGGRSGGTWGGGEMGRMQYAPTIYAPDI